MSLQPHRPCAFCSSSFNKITREHVWPNWIRNVLAQPPRRVALHRDGRAPIDWPLNANKVDMGVTLNDVCKPCNEGWMERLEAETRPILTPLIQGQDAVLAPNDQRTLAVWAVKTAMVFDLFTRAPEPFFNQSERIAMRDRRGTPPPEQLLVSLASIRGATHVASGIDYRVMYAASHRPNDPPGAAYCVTLSAGHAVFQVLAVRNFEDLRRVDPPFSVAAWNPAEARLIPATDASVHWPPLRILGPDAYSAFIERWRPNG